MLVDPVLRSLGCERGSRKRYVDCTVGLGGHAESILNATAPSGTLIGIDRDGEALKLASHRLRFLSDRVVLRKGSFKEIARILSELKHREADGFLFDLGVSSYQLENPERGFSFKMPGPMDMRMDRETGGTVADLINNWTQQELKEVIQKYGEERWAGRIATGIVRHRAEKGEIHRTDELEEIIWRAIPSRFRHGRIHPATRTFQAFRMVVNNELEQLESGLLAAISLLAIGGRLVVISFHSLEDRSVKRIFRSWSEGREGCAPKRFRTLYKKPVTAGPEEIVRNRRARSAKLRALERAA